MIKRILIPLLVFVPGILNAQVSNVNTPYSFSGIGQLNYQGFNAQRAMGNTGRALRSKSTFSFTNPASYSALEFADMEFGAGMSFIRQHSETQDKNFIQGSFDYIALGLPVIEDKLGLAIGLIPYSNAGYFFAEEVMEDSQRVAYTYEGIGSLNRIYVGLGMKLAKGLSVGFNVDYDFGNIRTNTDKHYLENFDVYSFQDIEDTKYRGLGFDLGVQYSVHNAKDITSVVAVTVNLGRDLRATNQRIFRTYNSVGGFVMDTLIDRTYPEVALSIPFGYGLAMQTGKADKWAMAVEYSTQMWSGFEDISGRDGFEDLVSFSVGGYYQFLSATTDQSSGSKFLKTMRFYAGLSYQESYITFNSQKIEEFGISFGLGIPMLKTITLSSGQVPMISMLNITAEWVQRGSTGNGLIQEDLITIRIGLNFNDKWFIKRKFQ